MHRALQKIAANANWFRKLAKFTLGSYYLLYYIVRFLRGKVDMPYVEISLTTRCTLRCEACAAMTPYFSKDTHYTCTLDGIQESLSALFKVIDSVQRVRVFGGEPLLFKDLAQVVLYLMASPKVRAFEIVTNGTLDFKKDALDALEGSRKARVIISNYKNSPNLKIPLRHESIASSLNERKIPYSLYLGDRESPWYDPGRIYKRGRPKEEIIKNFRACVMNYIAPANSWVMSSEGAKDSSLAPLGAVFCCGIPALLSRLKGLDEFEGDFIDIAAATRERIIDFYAQDYFKACDYCCNKWEEKRFIPVAVQTTETFSVERAEAELAGKQA